MKRLKMWPEPFDAVVAGRKAFTVRAIDDDTPTEGDRLTLVEFDPCSGPTDRMINVVVTYVEKPNDDSPLFELDATFAADGSRRAACVIGFRLAEVKLG